MWQCLQIIHILGFIQFEVAKMCLTRVEFFKKCNVFINDQEVAQSTMMPFSVMLN